MELVSRRPPAVYKEKIIMVTEWELSNVKDSRGPPIKDLG